MDTSTIVTIIIGLLQIIAAIIIAISQARVQKHEQGEQIQIERTFLDAFYRFFQKYKQIVVFLSVISPIVLAWYVFQNNPSLTIGNVFSLTISFCFLFFTICLLLIHRQELANLKFHLETFKTYEKTIKLIKEKDDVLQKMIKNL